MKSALFTTVLVTFLVNIACAKPPSPGPSISDLKGVWVLEGCVKALHERFLVLPYYQLIIEASEDGKTFRLDYNNNTEGIGNQLLGLERAENAGEYLLRVRMEVPDGLDRSPKLSRPFPVRVLLGFDDMGKVNHLTLPDNCFGFSAPGDRFVRIPVRWTQYIRRVVFAGKWKDERGDVFSFEESGKGHWPYRLSFTYKVLLDLGGGRVEFCRFPSWGPICKNYCFRRIANELRFFRGSAFLVLKKE